MSAPPRDALAFLDFVRGQCAALGTRLVFDPSSQSKGGDVGSFDHVANVLVVYVGRADWLLTLAHELGHLRQYVERRAFYTSSAADVEAFDAWCAGKIAIKPRRLRHVTRAIQRIELDASRRGLRYVRDFTLGDVHAYVRDFNLYVWRYEIARRVGFWPHYGPAIPEIVRAMPVRLMPQTAIGRPPLFLEQMAIRPRDASALEKHA